jgi:hypothetical protein
MAKTGAFRDDLFYRLSVMTLDLPPLRSYKDNLETLANVFLEQSASMHGKPAPKLGTAVLARLSAYDFPGNMRELKNTIEHAVILCVGDELQPEDLPRPLQTSSSNAKPVKDKQQTLAAAREVWLEPLERQYLTDLLAKHGGNVKIAARAAGINTVLYRLLARAPARSHGTRVDSCLSDGLTSGSRTGRPASRCARSHPRDSRSRRESATALRPGRFATTSRATSVAVWCRAPCEPVAAEVKAPSGAAGIGPARSADAASAATAAPLRNTRGRARDRGRRSPRARTTGSRAAKVASGVPAPTVEDPREIPHFSCPNLAHGGVSRAQSRSPNWVQRLVATVTPVTAHAPRR